MDVEKRYSNTQHDFLLGDVFVHDTVLDLVFQHGTVLDEVLAMTLCEVQCLHSHCLGCIVCT